jgi:hypothetical protein
VVAAEVTIASSMPWVVSAPLAGPVLPVVKPTSARVWSPTRGSRAPPSPTAVPAGWETGSASSRWPPHNQRRPAVILMRSPGKERGNSTRTRWATGSPMKASARTER